MMDAHVPAEWSADESEPVDMLAVLNAQVDQVASHAPQWARMLRTRYDAMMSEGWDSQQALYFLAIEMSSNPDPRDV